MSNGLETTFKILAKNNNEAAIKVLLPALKSTHQSIQEGALAALLENNNPAGHNEILNRAASIGMRWNRIIEQHPGRLTGAMRIALMGKDEKAFQNACKVAVTFRDYELITSLLTALENIPPAKAQLAGDTLKQLIVLFCNEKENQNEKQEKHNWLSKHFLACLEASVQRFGKHKCREILESFLMLTDNANSTLNQILQNPLHVSFLLLTDIMSKSSQKEIMALPLRYLDDPHAPAAVLNVIGNRSDIIFIRQFMQKIGRQPSTIVCQNLKRIETIPWLNHGIKIFNQLEENIQDSFVLLVLNSGIHRDQAFSLIEHVLLYGKHQGRREAARALASFIGSNANELALRALDDSDPFVQTSILKQLRHRGIPGVLPRITALLDSPHDEVKQAARENLTEFTFIKYLGSFDLLDDATRQTNGILAKKVDSQTIPLLRNELNSPIRKKRLRALQIAGIIDVAEEVEDSLIVLMQDEDHIIRAEAAVLLGSCNSQASRKVLEAALGDTNMVVKEAAQRSLRKQLM